MITLIVVGCALWLSIGLPIALVALACFGEGVIRFFEGEEEE